MTAKQKAAIEEAAKLPTAEETLRKHIDNSDPMNQPFDEMYVGETNAMLDAIESHTAAHTAALQERVKELEAENERYREALERAYNDFKSSRWTEETYKIVIEALKNNEG